MNIKQELQRLLGDDNRMQLNDVELDPASIRAVMINEVVPQDPAQDFYGESGEDYLSTTIPLFQRAGAEVACMDDILRMGVYITNAVKTPKSAYAVEPAAMEESLPWLEAELALFPNVQVMMLMGDVAKKMVNRIVRKSTKKNVIPSGATYKLRATPFFWGAVRVMPSYMITGGNILIEKSKAAMVVQDIETMMTILRRSE